MDEDSIRELLRSKEVRFSVDSVDPELYTQLRGASEHQYSMAMGNIGRLMELRKSVGSGPNVGVTFIAMEPNFREMGRFTRHMLDLGTDSVIVKYDLYGEHSVPQDAIEFINREVERIADPRVELRDAEPIEVNGIKCFIPYFKASFNPYGDLFSCCLGAQPNEKNGYHLGKFPERSIEDIWKDSEELRRQMRTDGVECDNCNYTDHRINVKITEGS